jgi:phosphoribosyl 1,2-cyclic phosphodiesterase
MNTFDHCKYVKDFLKMGIDCYMSSGTKEAIGIGNYSAKTVESKKVFKIGTFSIMPFDTQHDCSEPLGFLIYSETTGEKLMFATDTYYIKYKFSGLTHILVECNYSEKTLDPDCPYQPRLIKSHFSLENVIEFLKANDLSNVKEIHLMHLSEKNSDENYFKEEVQKATGKHVIICGE